MKTAPERTIPAAPDRSPAQPLRLARAGEVLVIEDIRAGTGLRQHLAERHLGIGAKLTVETGGNKGPMVVRAHGARLVLSRAMVERIHVHPAPAGTTGHAHR